MRSDYVWSGAFERLFQEQIEGVLSSVCLLLGCWSEAEDVAQEAFFRAWREFGRRIPDHAPQWLRRVARNLAIDRLRGRKPTSRISGPQSSLMVTEFDDRGMEETEHLERLLGRLAPQQARALRLMVLSGLSSEEAGVEMACSPPTARRHLADARTRLREILT
ncbi:MAG: RNA polymerase sigma factor [Planctomycetota bacterium]|jgi:RNA polymerase sigma factor (sigma-70 family)|nr:RNA polymerase sigma factor [Planctomycetota bacterium]